MQRRELLVLLGFWPFIDLQQPDEEDMWRDFVAWLKGLDSKPRGGFTTLVRHYESKLVADGVPPGLIRQHVTAVRKRYLTRTEAMQEFFNKVYSADESFFSKQPNAFLVRMTKELDPGKALDVSMGQGRNGLYLAKQGWQVTGFDVSDEGLDIARANASHAGLQLDARLCGYQDFAFGHDCWDLIALVYAFFPVRDAGYIRKIKDSLRPGGIIVFEHYMYAGDSDAQKHETGMIGMPASNELLRIFAEFRIIRYEEVQAVPDWMTTKKRTVVRLVAQKKASRAEGPTDLQD